jgi:hypothetical protein
MAVGTREEPFEEAFGDLYAVAWRAAVRIPATETAS